MNQINQPGDVARAMLWLASDDASFVTGEVLTIDGGQSLTTNSYSDYLKELSSQKGDGGFVGQVFGTGK
jgi:hypothetical protein